MKPVLKKLVVAGLLAGVGFAALAQKAGNHEAAGDGRPGMHRMDPAKMDAIHAKRSAELKAKLKITAAQEADWSAFTNAMKPPVRGEKPKMDKAELAKLPTPERLDKMKALRAEMVSERNTRMEQRDAAVKTFYATLTPEQKKVFDTESAAHRGNRHGKGHH
jgi:Spy/CpxP family protein refolding chaperone